MEKNSSSKEVVESEKEAQAQVEEEEEEEEEEFVLLDLDGIADHIPVPENAPYVLSGLDTLNPILVIDNKIKLIGEYKETIGTCLIFNESDEQEAGPSEAKRTPAKQINPMTQVHKVLKFRLYLEPDSEDGAEEQADDVGNKNAQQAGVRPLFLHKRSPVDVEGVWLQKALN